MSPNFKSMALGQNPKDVCAWRTIVDRHLSFVRCAVLVIFWMVRNLMLALEAQN